MNMQKDPMNPLNTTNINVNINKFTKRNRLPALYKAYVDGLEEGDSKELEGDRMMLLNAIAMTQQSEKEKDQKQNASSNYNNNHYCNSTSPYTVLSSPSFLEQLDHEISICANPSVHTPTSDITYGPAFEYDHDQNTNISRLSPRLIITPQPNSQPKSIYDVQIIDELPSMTITPTHDTAATTAATSTSPIDIVSTPRSNVSMKSPLPMSPPGLGLDLDLSVVTTPFTTTSVGTIDVSTPLMYDEDKALSDSFYVDSSGAFATPTRGDIGSILTSGTSTTDVYNSNNSNTVGAIRVQEKPSPTSVHDLITDLDCRVWSPSLHTIIDREEQEKASEEKSPTHRPRSHHHHNRFELSPFPSFEMEIGYDTEREEDDPSANDTNDEKIRLSSTREHTEDHRKLDDTGILRRRDNYNNLSISLFDEHHPSLNQAPPICGKNLHTSTSFYTSHVNSEHDVSINSCIDVPEETITSPMQNKNKPEKKGQDIHGKEISGLDLALPAFLAVPKIKLPSKGERMDRIMNHDIPSTTPLTDSTFGFDLFSRPDLPSHEEFEKDISSMEIPVVSAVLAVSDDTIVESSSLTAAYIKTSSDRMDNDDDTVKGIKYQAKKLSNDHFNKEGLSSKFDSISVKSIKRMHEDTEQDERYHQGPSDSLPLHSIPDSIGLGFAISSPSNAKANCSKNKDNSQLVSDNNIIQDTTSTSDGGVKEHDNDGQSSIPSQSHSSSAMNNTDIDMSGGKSSSQDWTVHQASHLTVSNDFTSMLPQVIDQSNNRFGVMNQYKSVSDPLHTDLQYHSHNQMNTRSSLIPIGTTSITNIQTLPYNPTPNITNSSINGNIDSMMNIQPPNSWSSKLVYPVGVPKICISNGADINNTYPPLSSHPNPYINSQIPTMVSGNEYSYGLHRSGIHASNSHYNRTSRHAFRSQPPPPPPLPTGYGGNSMQSTLQWTNSGGATTYRNEINHNSNRLNFFSNSNPNPNGNIVMNTQVSRNMYYNSGRSSYQTHNSDNTTNNNNHSYGSNRKYDFITNPTATTIDNDIETTIDSNINLNN
jgi:hypothetical protein